MGWLLISALVLVAISETALGQDYGGRRPEPVCGPVCMIACEFGNVLDSRGCPTCACKTGPGGPFPPTIPTPCPPGSRAVRPRTVCQLGGFSGAMNTQCRPGSLLFRGAADEPGLCCRSYIVTNPTDPMCPPDNTFTTCQVTRDSCLNSQQCPNGLICCPRGCGRRCVPAPVNSYRPGK